MLSWKPHPLFGGYGLGSRARGREGGRPPPTPHPCPRAGGVVFPRGHHLPGGADGGGRGRGGGERYPPPHPPPPPTGPAPRSTTPPHPTHRLPPKRCFWGAQPGVLKPTPLPPRHPLFSPPGSTGPRIGGPPPPFHLGAPPPLFKNWAPPHRVFPRGWPPLPSPRPPPFWFYFWEKKKKFRGGGPPPKKLPTPPTHHPLKTPHLPSPPL